MDTVLYKVGYKYPRILYPYLGHYSVYIQRGYVPASGYFVNISIRIGSILLMDTLLYSTWIWISVSVILDTLTFVLDICGYISQVDTGNCSFLYPAFSTDVSVAIYCCIKRLFCIKPYFFWSFWQGWACIYYSKNFSVVFWSQWWNEHVVGCTQVGLTQGGVYLGGINTRWGVHRWD